MKRRITPWARLSWGQFGRQLRAFGSSGGAKVGRPVTSLGDLLARPEWAGATVVGVEERYTVGDAPTAPADAAWPYGRRIRAEGPRLGWVQRFTVVRHPSGAEARIREGL